jgi:hypothetical protein
VEAECVRTDVLGVVDVAGGLIDDAVIDSVAVVAAAIDSVAVVAAAVDSVAVGAVAVGSALAADGGDGLVAQAQSAAMVIAPARTARRRERMRGGDAARPVRYAWPGSAGRSPNARRRTHLHYSPVCHVTHGDPVRLLIGRLVGLQQLS